MRGRCSGEEAMMPDPWQLQAAIHGEPPELNRRSELRSRSQPESHQRLQSVICFSCLYMG